MGERGNIFFADQVHGSELRGMYFYSHWGGPGMPYLVREALKRGEDRWTDPSYLARIVFCEILQGDLLGERSYGLSTKLVDNEYPIVRIHALGARVSFHEEGTETNVEDAGTASWSFQEYVAASDDELAEKFGIDFSEFDDDDDDGDDDGDGDGDGDK